MSQEDLLAYEPDPEVIANGPQAAQQFPCPHCDAIFGDLRAVDLHLNAVHPSTLMAPSAIAALRALAANDDDYNEEAHNHRNPASNEGKDLMAHGHAGHGHAHGHQDAPQHGAKDPYAAAEGDTKEEQVHPHDIIVVAHPSAASSVSPPAVVSATIVPIVAASSTLATNDDSSDDDDHKTTAVLPKTVATPVNANGNGSGQATFPPLKPKKGGVFPLPSLEAKAHPLPMVKAKASSATAAPADTAATIAILPEPRDTSSSEEGKGPRSMADNNDNDDPYAMPPLPLAASSPIAASAVAIAPSPHAPQAPLIAAPTIFMTPPQAAPSSSPSPAAVISPAPAPPGGISASNEVPAVAVPSIPARPVAGSPIIYLSAPPVATASQSSGNGSGLQPMPSVSGSSPSSSVSSSISNNLPLLPQSSASVIIPMSTTGELLPHHDAPAADRKAPAASPSVAAAGSPPSQQWMGGKAAPAAVVHQGGEPLHWAPPSYQEAVDGGGGGPPSYDALALPPGWTQVTDPAGRAVYINHNTRATQWERPTMATVPYDLSVEQKARMMPYQHPFGGPGADPHLLRAQMGRAMMLNGMHGMTGMGGPTDPAAHAAMHQQRMAHITATREAMFGAPPNNNNNKNNHPNLPIAQPVYASYPPQEIGVGSPTASATIGGVAVPPPSSSLASPAGSGGSGGAATAAAPVHAVPPHAHPPLQPPTRLSPATVAPMPTPPTQRPIVDGAARSPGGRTPPTGVRTGFELAVAPPVATPAGAGAGAGAALIHHQHVDTRPPPETKWVPPPWFRAKIATGASAGTFFHHFMYQCCFLTLFHSIACFGSGYGAQWFTPRLSSGGRCCAPSHETDPACASYPFNWLTICCSVPLRFGLIVLCGPIFMFGLFMDLFILTFGPVLCCFCCQCCPRNTCVSFSFGDVDLKEKNARFRYPSPCWLGFFKVFCCYMEHRQRHYSVCPSIFPNPTDAEYQALRITEE